MGGGTQYWRAPEVLDSKITRKPLAGQQWKAADVYSFGMTCYEVLTGKIPLGDLRQTDFHLVLEGTERPPLPNHVPKRLKEIIRRCWLHDPASRPSLADVLVCLEEVDNHRLANTGLGIPRSFMKLLKSHRELPESPRLHYPTSYRHPSHLIQKGEQISPSGLQSMGPRRNSLCPSST